MLSRPFRNNSRWLVAAMLLCAAPVSLHAQSAVARVTGTVRDGVTGAPIVGAVVSLFDAENAVQHRTVTGARGEYRIERTARSTRLQLLRLGFRPQDVVLVATGGSRDTTVNVTMERIPNLLEGMRVTARAACPAREDTPVAFSLWEQARSALLASVVTRESQTASLRRYGFVRETDGQRESRVTRMTVTTDSATGNMASFVAAFTPAGFVRNGFVRDTDDERVYYGPDAEVLLSDAFLDGYCMQLSTADRAHPERVGVRFTPVRRRGDRVEIDGTLWIDTAARSLSHIEYEYLVPDGRLRALRPGGQVYFANMPNGTILIDHWSMRLAGFAMESVPGIRSTTVRIGGRPQISGGAAPASRLVSVVSETGGALAEAFWRDSTEWRGTFGTLALRVPVDSGGSLTGRELKLSRSPYSARVDTNGQAVFTELIAGRYDVYLSDDRLRTVALDLTVPVPGEVRRGDTLSISLRVPTAESFVIERCKRAKQWSAGDLPLLLLRVGTDFTAPMEGARVSIAWESAAGGWQEARKEFTTGTDGISTYCASAAAIGRRVRISALTRDKQGAVVELMLGETLQVVPIVVTPTER